LFKKGSFFTKTFIKDLEYLSIDHYCMETFASHTNVLTSLLCNQVKLILKSMSAIWSMSPFVIQHVLQWLGVYLISAMFFLVFCLLCISYIYCFRYRQKHQDKRSICSTVVFAPV